MREFVDLCWFLAFQIQILKVFFFMLCTKWVTKASVSKKNSYWTRGKCWWTLTDLISTQRFSRKWNYKKPEWLSSEEFSLLWRWLVKKQPYVHSNWQELIQIHPAKWVIACQECYVKDSWITWRHTRRSQNILFPWLYFVLFLLCTQVHCFCFCLGGSVLNFLHSYPRNIFY